MVDFSKFSSDRNLKKENLKELFDIGDKKQVEKDASKIAGVTEYGEEQLQGLNKEQSNMVIGISKYIRSELELPFYMVQGSGGTGKSFSVIRSIMNIPVSSVIAAAPSHFAKNVLQEFLGLEYRVTTIAGLLGKKVSYDDSGKEVLKPIKNHTPPICLYPVIIIDEASMVDDDTFKEIVEYVEKTGKKLIVLGDYCQLPPVNQQHDSLFFNQISVELVQPMRFTGLIYDLAGYVRDEIIKVRNGSIPKLNAINIKTDRISKIDERGSGYIFINNLRSLIDAAIRRFKRGKGADYVRVVAYRNKTIDKINHHIRKGLYGENPKQFEVGELIINNGGFSTLSKGRKKQIISNGSVFEVREAVEIVGPYGIPSVSLKFKGKYFENNIITVSTKGMEMFNRIEARLKRIAKNDISYWKDYFSFKDSFASFSYSYAASCHKVQGSSIKHIFILEDDIYSVRPTSAKEKLQSLYVAITRASFRVYVYNKDFKVNNKLFNRDYLPLDYDD